MIGTRLHVDDVLRLRDAFQRDVLRDVLALATLPAALRRVPAVSADTRTYSVVASRYAPGELPLEKGIGSRGRPFG